ncbi:MAG: alpha/beta hydrolase [Caldilineaceae bacterium]|nr:alpha/beta hydrolase [Caldilineaceae bacterium]
MEREVLRRSILERLGSKVDEHQIEVNGLATHFLTAGKGTPLLLIHGSVDCGALSWYPILPTLARNFHVIVPDCPGYGESAKPHVTYDVPFYVQWLEAFLEAVGVTTAPLVGTSQGGAIALNFALHQPKQISRMVLINPAGLIHQYSVSVLRLVLRSLLQRFAPCRLFERWLEDYMLYDRSCLDDVFALVKRYEQRISALPEVQSLGALTRSLRITRALPVGQVQKIIQPTLLVCGEHDYIFPPNILKAIVPQFPNAQLQVVPQAGHALQIEKPSKLIEIALPFLMGMGANSSKAVSK